MHNQNTQRGFVSILSVIFFTILMSVLTISFLRIMTDEQSQVVDDDLSKGALASAESGVEDAKRALAYCRSLSGSDRTNCYQALNNQNCPGMFDPSLAGNPLPTALGLDTSAGGGAVRVGSQSNNQRYTCVTTQLQTQDVVGQASESQAELVPLRSSGNYSWITVYWHQEATDGDAAVPTVGSDNQMNWRYSEWKNPISNQRFIPVLRLQLIAFDSTKTLPQMEDSSVGMFLHPMTSAGRSVTSPLTVTGPISTGSIADKRVEVQCNMSALQSGYACALKIGVPANFANDNVDYYMLVKSIYGSPHYKIELSNASGLVQFDDVQPRVDSTGAAGDVFRRVISRVSYTPDSFMTTNALESGLSVCKDYLITGAGASSGSSCPLAP